MYIYKNIHTYLTIFLSNNKNYSVKKQTNLIFAIIYLYDISNIDGFNSYAKHKL